MRLIRASVLFVAVSALVLSGQAESRAASTASGTCISTCSQAIGGCVKDFILAKSSCKEQCRTSSSRRDCLSSCKGSFAAGREGCAADLVECKEACEIPEDVTPPGGGGEGSDVGQCIEGCAGDLRTCSERPLATALVCSGSCRDQAKLAKDACRTNPLRAFCYGQVSLQFASCLGGCFWDSRIEGAQCLSDFHSCDVACLSGGGGGGGYGSASAAFLGPVPNLIE